ncbi:E3 ubiquitin-protein ligase RLIM-like [Chenopodium quinoa]|uniref:RING-type domain-containing protein n=1 Tax=Chenopodium quinoa TaxID=63459 RepID=A0A803KQI6_CHEQI|nr:E3 ubiquitin-protein ligase RLIM-like [Chenopodium quinoa]
MADHHHQPSSSGAHSDSDLKDIDQVLVVPDTPDRVFKQTKNVSKILKPMEASSRNSGLTSRGNIDRRNRRLGDTYHASGKYSHSGGNFGDVARSQGANGSSIPSSSLRNAPLSSTVASKTSKHNDRHNCNHQLMEDDRVSHSSLQGISSHHCKRSQDPILVEHGDILKFSSKSSRNDLGAQKMNGSYMLPNNDVSLQTAAASSKSTRSDNKGKVKVGHDNPIHTDAWSVKGDNTICLVTSDHDTGEGLSVPPHSSRVPSTTRQKRFVRNGYISPHNIEKTKRLAETSGNGSENAECAAEPGGSRPVIDVNEVPSKQNAASQAKGKGLLILDSSPKGHAGRRSDGWCKRKFSEKDCIIVQHTSGNPNKLVLGKNTSSCPSKSSEQKPVLSEGQLHTPSSVIKRQKKHDLSLGRPEKNDEVICLSSGGESSTRKSVRDHGGFPQSKSGSLLAFNGLSPEVRENVSQTDNDSEARAVQLQVDEMLARELQEQLYNEISEPTSDERFSSVGWVMPQEDRVQPASSRGSRRAHASVAAPPSIRHQASQSQSLRNRLFRRGAQARVPRPPRLRSHVYRHPRGRIFPSDMDVDMRIDLLERLEAVVNDDIRMVNQLLDPDREFGENDYEMLLALDENNYAHLGASVAQIGNLPESIVHNDDCEVCSICLETPVIGDAMRHLPCLHKFHKDCIDPWLSRRRSCPVCKSDI